jgi:hypothetical protein
MNRIKIWRPVGALSLDIVAGAVCGGMLAAHVTRTVMPVIWWVLLPAAVWVIYTADHLLDAARIGSGAHSYRHRFHARHFASLTIWTVLTGLSGLAAALFLLPPDLFRGGAFVAGLVFLYLFAAQISFGRLDKTLVRPGFPKEPLAGVLYAAGIWFGPLLRADRLAGWDWLAAGLFGLGAILNLLAGSVFDVQEDRQEGHASVAARWGASPVRKMTLILCAAGVVAAAAAAWAGPDRLAGAFLVIGVLSAGPAVGLLFQTTSEGGDSFRTWGDLLFLVPAIPFVAAWLT